jgi:hypothetical protein
MTTRWIGVSFYGVGAGLAVVAAGEILIALIT